MESQDFRSVAIGDEFRLDGRVYQKRTKYSAQLIRSASGDSPQMTINRMIDPDKAVESVSVYADGNNT
jgi:hypothetical protein